MGNRAKCGQTQQLTNVVIERLLFPSFHAPSTEAEGHCKIAQSPTEDCLN